MNDHSPQSPGPNGHDPGARRGAMAGFALDADAREDLRRMVEETPVPLRQIALARDVPPGSLHRFVTEQGWTRPPDAPKALKPAGPARPRLAGTLDDAGAVMGRLIRAVDRQLWMIENRLKKRGAAIEEKDARILATLARTLTTLMALERDGGAKPDQTEAVNRADYRTDLARRIAAWADEGEEPDRAAGDPDGA